MSLKEFSKNGIGTVPINYPGQFAITKNAENNIPFGRGVKVGMNSGVRRFSGTTGEFLGVAMASDTASGISAENFPYRYEDGDVCAVCTQGYIMVDVAEAVSPDDPVRIVHTTAVNFSEGAFCTTANSGHTGVLSGARFAGETSGAGKVALFLSSDPKKTVTND